MAEEKCDSDLESRKEWVLDIVPLFRPSVLARLKFRDDPVDLNGRKLAISDGIDGDHLCVRANLEEKPDDC